MSFESIKHPYESRALAACRSETQLSSVVG